MTAIGGQYIRTGVQPAATQEMTKKQPVMMIIRDHHDLLNERPGHLVAYNNSQYVRQQVSDSLFH
jgi:hypothetical protein